MPRASYIDSGLPGPGQTPFPAQARATGRALGLVDTCDLLVESLVDDGAGGKYHTWAVETSDVPCRLDPLGGGGAGLKGEQVSEDSTHVLTVANGSSVDVGYKATCQGVTWAVKAVHERTDELVVRAEVIQA